MLANPAFYVLRGWISPRVSHNFVTFRDEQRYMEEINLFEKKKKKENLKMQIEKR